MDTAAKMKVGRGRKKYGSLLGSYSKAFSRYSEPPLSPCTKWRLENYSESAMLQCPKTACPGFLDSVQIQAGCHKKCSESCVNSDPNNVLAIKIKLLALFYY